MIKSTGFKLTKQFSRLFSTEKEKTIYDKLKKSLNPTILEVIDKSSGCT